MNNTLILHQFTPIWGLPNASPFCMKLETFLKIAKIDYKISKKVEFSRAPKGKFPFIEDDGKFIADTNFIIPYLSRKHYLDLNAHLNEAEKAISLAFQRLFEENLYWVNVYYRWIDKRFWPITKTDYFFHLPPVIKFVVPEIVKRGVAKQLAGHGIGLHNKQEIAEIGIRDMQAISSFLSSKPYFMGDKISLIDATAFAFLANIIYAPMNTPLKEFAMQQNNIKEYCQRMKELYFLD